MDSGFNKQGVGADARMLAVRQMTAKIIARTQVHMRADDQGVRMVATLPGLAAAGGGGLLGMASVLFAAAGMAAEGCVVGLAPEESVDACGLALSDAEPEESDADSEASFGAEVEGDGYCYLRAAESGLAREVVQTVGPWPEVADAAVVCAVGAKNVADSVGVSVVPGGLHVYSGPVEPGGIGAVEVFGAAVGDTGRLLCSGVRVGGGGVKGETGTSERVAVVRCLYDKGPLSGVMRSLPDRESPGQLLSYPEALMGSHSAGRDCVSDTLMRVLGFDCTAGKRTLEAVLRDKLVQGACADVDETVMVAWYASREGGQHLSVAPPGLGPGVYRHGMCHVHVMPVSEMCGFGLSTVVESYGSVVCMEAHLVTGPVFPRVRKGRVLCGDCRCVVVAEGHEERCRPVGVPRAFDVAGAWLGDVIHRLDVRRAILDAGVGEKLRTVVEVKYVAGAAQAAYVRAELPGLGKGDDRALSNLFEAHYVEVRLGYLDWLYQRLGFDGVSRAGVKDVGPQSGVRFGPLSASGVVSGQLGFLPGAPGGWFSRCDESISFSNPLLMGDDMVVIRGWREDPGDERRRYEGIAMSVSVEGVD